MSKGYLLLINLIVIALISYLAADMVDTFIGAKLEPSHIPAQNSRQKKAEERRPKEKNYYSTIIERNIFNSRAKASLNMAEVKSPDDASMEIGELNIRLNGTIVGEGIIPYAIIEEQNAKEQRLFRLNETIAKDVKIVTVERNFIVVANNSAQKRIEIYEDIAPANDSERLSRNLEEKTGSLGNQQGREGASSGKMMLDKREVANVLENLPRLLTQARLVPNFSQGKADGFRVVSMVPDSFYAKIGLKNGDVLQRINGMELKEPDSFFKIFQQLKDENNITLDIARNNKKETFNYEIQ